MKITKKSINASRVVGADEDIVYEEDGEVVDTLDNVSDKIDDLQDQVEEVDEDEVDIETDNNIAEHYIAECDVCHGIFISAMIQSDQEVDNISGVCPLCGKESEQFLKWVVKPIEDVTEDK